MKASTLLAIVAAVAGVALIVYLATRPRGAAAALTTGESEGEAASSSSSPTARAVRGVATGVAEAVSGIAELA